MVKVENLEVGKTYTYYDPISRTIKTGKLTTKQLNFGSYFLHFDNSSLSSLVLREGEELPSSSSSYSALAATRSYPHSTYNEDDDDEFYGDYPLSSASASAAPYSYSTSSNSRLNTYIQAIKDELPGFKVDEAPDRPGIIRAYPLTFSIHDPYVFINPTTKEITYSTYHRGRLTSDQDKKIKNKLETIAGGRRKYRKTKHKQSKKKRTRKARK